MKLFFVCIVAYSLIGTSIYAQKMNYVQYENRLAEYAQREKGAKEQIAEEQSQIEALKAEVNQIEQKILSVKNELYRVLGITDEDVIALDNNILNIKNQLESLLALSPEDLAAQRSKLDRLKKEVEKLKKKPAALLFAQAAKIAELEDLLQQLYNSLPSGVMTYTVRLIPERRDCLWRIAEYTNIYSDPWKWPRIFEANKDLIKENYQIYRKEHGRNGKYERPEDLIHPGQILTIPK